jgi:hypothetical protein
VLISQNNTIKKIFSLGGESFCPTNEIDRKGLSLRIINLCRLQAKRCKRADEPSAFRLKTFL